VLEVCVPENLHNYYKKKFLDNNSEMEAILLNQKFLLPKTQDRHRITEPYGTVSQALAIFLPRARSILPKHVQILLGALLVLAQLFQIDAAESFL